MTAQTGRTTNKWTNFLVHDATFTLRTIPVDSINGIGLTFDEVELTAFMDAVKGVLPAHPDCVITIGGPVDTSAVQTAGTLSGSHTVLKGIVGGTTALGLDIRIGMRHAWETGEPSFGYTGSSGAGNGFICTDYQMDGNGKYTAKFRCFPGSPAPEWNTVAHT